MSALRSLAQRHGVTTHVLGTLNFISKTVNMRTFYPKLGFCTDIPLQKQINPWSGNGNLFWALNGVTSIDHRDVITPKALSGSGAVTAQTHNHWRS